jgi:hypothetical protein
LDSEITNVQTSHSKRKEAIKGSFYDLTIGIQQAASDRIDEIDLKHVKYYHDLRNKLYHESDGITIPAETAKEYANIAVKFLKILFKIDLSDILNKEEIIQKELIKIDILEKHLKDWRERLMNELDLCIEQIEPVLIEPSFIEEMDRLTSENVEEYLWNICRFVEKYFGVDMDDHFSDSDKDSVNRVLKEKQEPDLSHHESIKETMFRVINNWFHEEVLNWDIKNLQIGNYIISNLSFEDFTRGRCYLYMEIVMQITMLNESFHSYQSLLHRRYSSRKLVSAVCDGTVPVLEEELDLEVIASEILSRQKLNYEDNEIDIKDLSSDISSMRNQIDNIKKLVSLLKEWRG